MHYLYFNILDRRIADFYRKRGRNRVDAVEDLPEPEDTTAHEAEQRDERRQFHSLLNVLTERERTVVWLHYFEGLTTSQIALRMAIKQGTVCSDLTVARKKLRDNLGDL